MSGPLEQVALHTRLKPGMEEAYDREHAVVPAALATRLRETGVRSWRIWRNGRDLFHLVEVEDYQAMRRALAEDPVNVAWQEQMARLLEVQDDYSGEDRGVALVWQLP